MSRPTNNYSQKNIDFLKTIAEIGKPFNSTLLDNYNEYLSELSSEYTPDKKECFLSILNKVGEDGCQVLTDRIINYIDDISNIDTSIPSALLSQANSIGYPYKDNKTVEQLSRLSKCSQTLQNLVWATSTNARNAITILSRLNVIDEDKISSLSATYNIDEVDNEISSDISNIIYSKIFDRHFLYLGRHIERDEETGEIIESESYDKVSSICSPSLLDFSWMVNAIYSNEIIKRSLAYQLYCSNTIDFGKYNRTIFSIICYNYLYSQIYSNTNSIGNIDGEFDVEYLSKLSHVYMSFLYDNNAFDPLQAAWSIIFNAATLSDFDSRYHEIINDFIKAFNEKLDKLSYNAVIQFLEKNSDETDTLHENYQFVYRLNANAFTYQQLMYNFINDVRTMFGIDIVDYASVNNMSFADFLFDESANYLSFCNERNEGGFLYLGDTNYSFFDKVDWANYITDIISEIFKLGKKIKTLREDLRIMTLRNSYKGTAALIQFSTIEYLRDCIDDLLYQAQEKFNDDQLEKYNKGLLPDKPQKEKLGKEVFDAVLKEVNSANQEDIAVGEYWDYTEYFNRVDDSDIDKSLVVDWNNPLDDENPDESWRVYGTMDENEIFDFYKQVLNLPKDVLVFSNLQLETEQNRGINLYPDTELSTQQQNLKVFLKAVYDSGVFTKRTNSNYEAIYSGVKEFTTNDSPWIAYKNTDYISKEIHPYIWNFTQDIVQRLYNSGAITTAIQNAEFDIVNNHIGDKGNIINQYRLSSNFVDSSGYVTRYEHRNHFESEKTLSYDGILYPEFAYEMTNTYHNNPDDIISAWNDINLKWYVNQTIALSKTGEERERDNLIDFIENEDYLKSVNIDNSDSFSECSGFLEDYCIDRYETAYGVNPHGNHEILYKENGYPFMRPLVNYGTDKNGQRYNKGMLFVNADDTIDMEMSIADEEIEKAKDSFPRIVMSEDGTHLLLRTGKNKLRSYYVTTHRNIYNEVEPALKLNVEISCDSTIFSNEMFNDSLIKTVDDSFYILVPKLEPQEDNSNISAFNNYLFYIKNKATSVKVKKESFWDISNNLFRSGLYLNGDHSVFTNTFYVNNSIKLSESEEETDVSAIWCDPSSSAIGNTQTLKKKWTVSESSFDVFDQFIHMYTSEKHDAKTAKSNFDVIKIDNTTNTGLLSVPKITLQTDYLNNNQNLKPYTTDISIDSNGFFKNELYLRTKFPLARAFNINSDAGFNPVYIGEDGKIILNHRTTQFDLTKSTGGAYELLGPLVGFNQTNITPIDDIYDEISDDNDINFERIHEFYSFPQDVSCLATSFNKQNSIYKYGYNSIVENYDHKFNVYAIKQIQHKTLDEIGYDNVEEELSGYVIAKGFDQIENESNEEDVENNYDFNRIYIFLGVKNTLYSLIPRKPTTKLQKIPENTSNNTEYSKIKQALAGGEKYKIKFEDTYVIDEIEFSYDETNGGIVKVYGNERELINAEFWLVHVIGNDTNIKPSVSDISALNTPNFMLPDSELLFALDNISADMIDDHMRAPHISCTMKYQDVSAAYYPYTDEKHESFKNDFVTDGSLVFSVTEVDSEYMNRQMPDQEKNHTIKSVTSEAFNDYYRFKELKTGTTKTGKDITFDTLNYSFIPWQFVDLNLKRVPDDTDIGYDIKPVELQYIIQPYDTEISVNQDSFNKYTISFWRSHEKDTDLNNPELKIDNRLPERIKTTEISTINGDNVYRPILGNEHESLYSLIKNCKFNPRLMVQWEYENNADKNSPIRLKFNNSLSSDSPFVNTEAGLEYKSLSMFKDAVELDPGESQYIDIVAPNHVQIGRTVFYNIPLMRAYVTNISDNKPKFMLTILNDKVDKHVRLESNSYALVFISASTPQISHSDIVYIQCYVAPMISNNQTKPPSITNAISLSELSFNFDIANIINSNSDKRLVDFKYVNAITGENKLSRTATSYVGFENNIHQIKVSEPYGTGSVEGFKVVDMKIDLKDLTKFTLKNALFTAHGDVIAYDNSRLSCPIMKIFGCSLDRIGIKHVLGVKKVNTATENEVLTVTQSSDRETALLVNPDSIL